MKYVKLYKQFEAIDSHLEFMLADYDIHDYKINEDGSVDVFQNVKLKGIPGPKIPIKFRKVDGNFDCSRNELETLENSPKEVTGSFYCYGNKLLKSLVGGPSIVRVQYDCSHCELESLEGAPDEVYEFKCPFNKLESLQGCPAEIHSDLDCRNNLLRQIDMTSNVGGDIDCEDNFVVDKNKTGFMGWCEGSIFI